MTDKEKLEECLNLLNSITTEENSILDDWKEVAIDNIEGMLAVLNSKR